MGKNSLLDLPTPSSLSYFWNFGSCLGLIFCCQILSGFFLVLHYRADVSLAFDSLSHILRDVSHGWLLRSVHANGATFFFSLSLRPYWSWYLLWRLLESLDLAGWISHFASSNSYLIFRLYLTLGTNIVLRGYRYYQPIFCPTLCRGRFCSLAMGGFF